jgi:hypothetical protein
MGRHRPRCTCIRCRRRRVPGPGLFCYVCSRTDPRLPPRDEPPLPRPGTKTGMVGE